MGDKIMKILVSILLSVFLVAALYAEQKGVVPSAKKPLHNEELSWVDQQVEAILPDREGVQESAINTIKRTFIFQEIKKDKDGKIIAKKVLRSQKRHYVSLRLKLIINSRALIGTRWYRLNDKIAGYRVAAIDKESVKLVKNGRVKILSIKTNKHRIKIYTK
jgi:hypothetical protein